MGEGRLIANRVGLTVAGSNPVAVGGGKGDGARVDVSRCGLMVRMRGFHPSRSGFESLHRLLLLFLLLLLLLWWWWWVVKLFC